MVSPIARLAKRPGSSPTTAPASVQLVDSAESVASEVRERLQREPGLAAGPSADGARHRFFVTDVPDAFQKVAERFLGRPIRTEACILGSREELE